MHVFLDILILFPFVWNNILYYLYYYIIIICSYPAIVFVVHWYIGDSTIIYTRGQQEYKFAIYIYILGNNKNTCSSPTLRFYDAPDKSNFKNFMNNLYHMQRTE